mmetsp:Transcript_36291/g.36962  ORF Transcript_36291/g.36962 Transcript_36291/m.36962 type:complete len:296 (-) Transcript_36291:12-899(-)
MKIKTNIWRHIFDIPSRAYIPTPCLLVVISMWTSLTFNGPCFGSNLLTWELLNGPVALPNTFNCDGLQIRQPELLGSGGGGSVFKVNIKSNSEEGYAILKVGWPKSIKSIENECSVLKYMYKNGPVYGTEKCIASCDLSDETDNSHNYKPTNLPHKMILMTPYVPPESAVSSITALSSSPISSNEVIKTAISNLIHILLDMLSTGVVSSDIQILVNKENGNILMIDMTEARIFPLTEISENELAIRNFISEILTMIPNDQLDSLHSSYTQSWQTLQASDRKISKDILDIIDSYDL